MPKYVIERTVPGAGDLSPDQLADLSAQSNQVLASFESGIQWVHSYVAADRLFCIYIADDEDIIREHARRGGFPCDKVRRVASIIDPTTGGR